MKADKPIVGLAGGIGSGKSTVASILSELGAAVISSDRINHEELNSPDVLARLRQWWGDKVVTPDGRADRQTIRGIVTRDPDARRRLEELVHPRIDRRSRQLLTEFQADPSIPMVVWDAPLLYEAGIAERCDRVIFVDSDPAVRLQRVARERGWSRDDLEQFENAQMPLDEKKQRADYGVTNNSDRDDLRRQVKDVFSRIVAGRP